MKKKLITIVVVLALVMGTLAACGGGELSGEWINDDGDIYKFSGKSFTYTFTYKNNETGKTETASYKGTYSVPGDKIELIHSGTNVRVVDFSRDGNNITIDGYQYTRD